MMYYIIYDKKLISLLIIISFKYQSNFLYFLCKKNKTLMINALESVTY